MIRYLHVSRSGDGFCIGEQMANPGTLIRPVHRQTERQALFAWYLDNIVSLVDLTLAHGVVTVSTLNVAPDP